MTASSGCLAGQKRVEVNGVTENGDGAGEQLTTLHFVIKSPPKASFIRMMHKLTKPFLNEVTWYLVSVMQSYMF